MRPRRRRDAYDHCKSRVKKEGLSEPGQVRVNKAGCMNRCAGGPVAVVYPEGVWYSYVDSSDIDEIVDSHLKRGEVVSGCCCRPTSAASGFADDTENRARAHRRAGGPDRVRDRPSRGRPARPGDRLPPAPAVRRHARQQGRADDRARLPRPGLGLRSLQFPRRRRLGGRLGRRPRRDRRCACVPAMARPRGILWLAVPPGRLFLRRLCRGRGTAPTRRRRSAAPDRPDRPVDREADRPFVPADTLVIHGESDDVVPLAATLAWARPQNCRSSSSPASATSSTARLPC